VKVRKVTRKRGRKRNTKKKEGGEIENGRGEWKIVGREKGIKRRRARIEKQVGNRGIESRNWRERGWERQRETARDRKEIERKNEFKQRKGLWIVSQSVR
jgi:hypothetical protein